MIEERIRTERLRRDLSQQELAQSAGVPRSQLAILEKGGNVTLATLQKVISRLDGLRLEVVPERLNVSAALHVAEEVQELALALHSAAGRLIEAFGGTARKEPEPAPLPLDAGPEEDPQSFDPELLQGLERVIDEILRRRERR